jgi:hypothetical protein
MTEANDANVRWRRRSLVAVVLLLYAVTWVGGWASHAAEMKDQTEKGYRRLREKYEWAERYYSARGETVPTTMRAHEGGPSWGAAWCVPVLPGVLLAWSHSSIGPLYGSAGLRLVVWYGLGSVVVTDVLVLLA